MFPVLIAGVLIGTICANCTGVFLIQTTGIFGNDFWIRVQMATPQINDMLWYIMVFRIREWFVWWLVKLTPLGETLCKGMIFILGFVNGMFSSISYIQQGSKGVLLFWLIMAIAYGIYYPGVIWLCTHIRKGNRTGGLTIALVGVIFAMICAFGETYFFVYVVKKISL